VTIQQERQDAPQLRVGNDRPFMAPNPQRAETRSELRVVFLGLPIALTLAVFTVLPHRGLTSSEPTPAPTSVVQTHHTN